MVSEDNPIWIFYVSERGKAVALELLEMFPKGKASKISKLELKAAWNEGNYILIIGALGLAVRYISELVTDKAKDPGVVVMDEWKRHCISVLSGHLGGANSLALYLSHRVGARPVITTASDILGLVSPDLLAKDLNLVIENKPELPAVTNRLIENGVLKIYMDEVKIPTPDYYLQVREMSEADIIVSFRKSVVDKSQVILRPKVLYVGIGFNSGTKAERIYECLNEVFEENGLSIYSINSIGTLDKKKDDLEFQKFLKDNGFMCKFFSAEELNKIPITKSQEAYNAVGAYGVSEPAAILLSDMGELLVPKVKFKDVTVAVAKKRLRPSKGSLKVVGIGPGDLGYLVPKARKAIIEADVVVGYEKYIRQIHTLLIGKDTYCTGMTKEVERCKKAIEFALEGRRVALVSGGDPNIYGMAGLVFEIISREFPYALKEVEVEVIPGISALNICAALLGGALMHDFACISLSDRLTPWDLIEKRIESAAMSDMVIVIYNPKSKGRREHLSKALEIVSRFRSKDTPVGVVKAATREGQSIKVVELKDVVPDSIDMETTLIIGNSTTFKWANMMITPRGYRL